MRKFFLILLLAAGVIACSKEKNTDDGIPRNIPEWLQVRIEKTKEALISEYKIDGVTYYNIKQTYEACMLCNLYTIEGVKTQVVIGQDTKVVHVRTVWPII